VDEDLLTPLLGRLIDQAKAAARRALTAQEAAATSGAAASWPEGVAILLGDETIESAYTGADPAQPTASAGGLALAAARAKGKGEVLAAAVSVLPDPGDTVVPTDETRRSLAAANPDLQLIIKRRGRWVMLPLSQLP
jgi:hypothetical protein